MFFVIWLLDSFEEVLISFRVIVRVRERKVNLMVMIVLFSSVGL